MKFSDSEVKKHTAGHGLAAPQKQLDRMNPKALLFSLSPTGSQNNSPNLGRAPCTKMCMDLRRGQTRLSFFADRSSYQGNALYRDMDCSCMVRSVRTPVTTNTGQLFAAERRECRWAWYGAS